MKTEDVMEKIRITAENKSTTLDLNNSQLGELPKEITQLTNLLELYLDGNQLRELPAEINQLTNLMKLHLANNYLRELPKEIGKLSRLEGLYINGNQLWELPIEIGQLSRLEELYLDRNQLRKLPAEITQLIKLKRLYLNNNQLRELPKEASQLINLERLYLNNNQLGALPKEITQLTNLLELYFANNELRELPAEINQLVNLVDLHLANNHLRELPKEIGQLTNLRRLYLNSNQLRELPKEIGQLTTLWELNFSSNYQLTSPPPEIVEQGREAVLAYLREQLQGGSRQWVSKLLVVGEGGVGKTSLLRALRGEDFSEQESTTHGIEIKPLMLNHPTEADITMQLNAWDFGGQEIYHATHQFFLTNRSLFLLVWNARHGFEQGKIYYWLDTIKARAPESPVIIVATWVDERDADIPLTDLQRKYPQIVAHLEVSNKIGKGIEELRREVINVAAGLPLMGERWPTNWLNAANAIRSKKEKRYIAPDQLWQLMAEYKVARDKATILAQWLHELGEILYFQQDEELNDIVILNPQWVTESISRVLESGEVIDNVGLFTRDHMNELWKDIEATMRDHFLRLMEKFDLSYRTLENREISLVVERLNLDPPNYQDKWSEIETSGSCNEISMKFALDTTVPAGVPTWFIARTHRFTTKTHWRFGALFADNAEPKHLGLIQSFPHDRFLKLTVRGPAPHNFFALLRDGLEVTLRRFPGIKMERRIPCPGHDHKDCTHEFDLAHLQSRIERNPPKTEIECPVSLEYVSVPKMLFGLQWSTGNEVLIRQYQEIMSEIKTIKGSQQELLALTQREFLKLFRREQERIESYCPNIFVLRPSESSNRLTRIYSQRMDLQLYCQAPGEWHPAQFGDPYKIDRPAEWLSTLAPYIKKMVSVLYYASPAIGPWISAMTTDEYEKRFKADIKIMKELVEKLGRDEAEHFDDPRLSVKLHDTYTEEIEGPALRALRKLLDEKDPQRIWGGLKRILTPEGHYLWLCRDHALEYAR